ncbi:MAG: hypothetical protein E6G64_04535 [Actinobacteria bacterium]|nr:MAG: hypothetical protein E6G64_04535 [Actinomycetota bacterium]
MAEHETRDSVRRGHMAALGLLGVIALGAMGASGAASGPTGEIAYVCQQANRAKICIVNADGTAVRGLTKSRAGEVQGPAWSPDGQKIAFARRIGRDWSIDVLDLRSGREQRVVSSSVVAWNPTWSPDGRKLAFEMTVETPAAVDLEGIFVANVNGSGLRRLTRTDVNAVMPSWSPDGRRIAHVRFSPPRNGRQDSNIWLMNANGRGQREVARKTSRPAWSPDGKSLAFVNGHAEICVMHPDGTSRRCLMKNTFVDNRPTWSPDGKWLAFDRCVRDRSLCEQVWIVRVDSTGARRLTTPKPSSANLDPTWREMGTG